MVAGKEAVDGFGRRRTRWALGLLTLCVALFAGASSASAATLLAVGPDIPTPPATLVVGQQNLPSTLAIINTSTQGEGAFNVTLSNITLVPACGVAASKDCPAASYDPNVIRLGNTGVGEAGSACAGTTFTITLVDILQSKYSFAPSTPVVLGPGDVGGAAARCFIDFTADVLKMPNIDAIPGTPGLQTFELGGADALAGNGSPGSGTGSTFRTFARVRCRSRRRSLRRRSCWVRRSTTPRRSAPCRRAPRRRPGTSPSTSTPTPGARFVRRTSRAPT